MNRAKYEQAPVLVPVLDVRSGLVVAARAGQRSTYAPIRSPLVAGSVPQDILAALLGRTCGEIAYLADLDGISGGPRQCAVVERLLRTFPGLQLWLDAGFRDVDDARAFREALGVDAARLLPVLGTETLAGLCDLDEAGVRDSVVLSLDFGPEGFRGDPAWLTRAQCWPQHVVVMTLVRVGTGQGPDLGLLQSMIGRAGARRCYAAGGVRDAADLRVLAALGIHGALVASALHAGQLPA